MYEYSLNMRFGELVQWVLHKCYGPVIVGSSPIVCIAYSKGSVYSFSILPPRACMPPHAGASHNGEGTHAEGGSSDCSHKYFAGGMVIATATAAQGARWL
jgi:hypothetical protein